jgi:hypothetical protein
VPIAAAMRATDWPAVPFFPETEFMQEYLIYRALSLEGKEIHHYSMLSSIEKLQKDLQFVAASK